MFKELGFNLIYNSDSIIYEKSNPSLKEIRVFLI